jgi:hypothetical protein
MTKTKKAILWGVGIIVGLLIISNLGSKTETVTASPEPSAAATEKPAPTPKPTPKNGKEITLEEFNKVEAGMTYEKVVEIIGSAGTVMSEVGKKGEKNHTVMYSWDASGFGSANATFQNDKLLSKAQIGLK